jgi:hypothetical protein
MIEKVRNIKDEAWYWVPRSVFERYLERIGVLGLALYNAYSFYAGNKGFAFPSLKTLSKKLKLNPKTIIKYNKILEKEGLIKIEKRKGKSNLVILLKVKEDMYQVQYPIVPNTIPYCNRYNGVLDVVHTNKNNMNKNKRKKEKEKEIYPIDVIDYFRKKVKALKGFEPEIWYGRDLTLIKERLKEFSFEELKDLIDWYLNSEYFERFGGDLSICLSNSMVNLWKSARSGQKVLISF